MFYFWGGLGGSVRINLLKKSGVCINSSQSLFFNVNSHFTLYCYRTICKILSCLHVSSLCVQSQIWIGGHVQWLGAELCSAIAWEDVHVILWYRSPLQVNGHNSWKGKYIFLLLFCRLSFVLRAFDESRKNNLAYAVSFFPGADGNEHIISMETEFSLPGLAKKWGRQVYLGKHDGKAQIAKKPLMPCWAPGYSWPRAFEYL